MPRSICCCHRQKRSRNNNKQNTPYAEPDIISELDFSHSGLYEIPDNIFLHERTLEKIVASSNRISDLPWSLFSCLSLSTLNLNDNKIEFLPDAIGFLIALEELDVGKNAIAELPNTLKECKLLRKLDISSNPIAVFPDALTQISGLEELYINNLLVKFLPANIGRLRRLRVLEARGNKITFLPSSFSKLTNLVKLDIGMNDIRNPQEVIQSLKSLEELWMDNNDLAAIAYIHTLGRLKTLELERNLMKTLSREVATLRHLVNLSIVSNSLVTLPNEIGELKNLRLIHAMDNRLVELPKTIGNCKSLEELNFNQNKLESLPPTIGLLRKLIVFHADVNNLKTIPKEIGSCVSLRILSLQSNKLKNIPSEIANLNNLTVLSLTKNKLQYLPISMIKLENLKSLWLAFNQGKPLVPLQRQYDPDTHTYVASSYLLPQKSHEQDLITPWNKVIKIKKTQHIKFSPDFSEKRGTLQRMPTPVPNKMKELSKFGKIPSVNDLTQITQVVEGQPGDQTPSTSKVVKTAVVRKQVENNTSDSISNLSCNVIDKTSACTGSSESTVKFVQPCIEAAIITSENADSETSQVPEVKFAIETTCSDKSNGQWLFGRHKYSVVVPVTVTKCGADVGFTASLNENNELVINGVADTVVSEPSLQVGDKILQINNSDVNNSPDCIDSLLNMETVEFSMVISRTN